MQLSVRRIWEVPSGDKRLQEMVRVIEHLLLKPSYRSGFFCRPGFRGAEEYDSASLGAVRAKCIFCHEEVEIGPARAPLMVLAVPEPAEDRATMDAYWKDHFQKTNEYWDAYSKASTGLAIAHLTLHLEDRLKPIMDLLLLTRPDGKPAWTDFSWGVLLDLLVQTGLTPTGEAIKEVQRLLDDRPRGAIKPLWVKKLQALGRSFSYGEARKLYDETREEVNKKKQPTTGGQGMRTVMDGTCIWQDDKLMRLCEAWER